MREEALLERKGRGRHDTEIGLDRLEGNIKERKA